MSLVLLDGARAGTSWRVQLLAIAILEDLRLRRVAMATTHYPELHRSLWD